MKKIYFFLMTICVSLNLNAQKDTLFFEGFEKVDFATMIKLPTGKDAAWVNWDKDAKASGSATIPSNWYSAPEIYQAQVTKPAVFNNTAHSLSWLDGDIPGSTNVLISPPVTIVDDKATLSWQSCPLQGPGFMDGYKVLVTVGSNDLVKAKPDTLFVAAEVTSYKDPGTLVLSDYKFSKGFIHANSYTNKKYWDTTGLTTFHRGRLEPHSVSLAKYKGKKIYIHFYHDSSDDYIFELDNVLVLGNKTIATKDVNANDISLVTYPSPVTDYVNVLYHIENTSTVNISVTNIEGKKMLQLYDGQGVGEMSHHFDVNALSAGIYFMQINVNGKIATEKFVKQ